jgi:hypothetical protein
MKRRIIITVIIIVFLILFSCIGYTYVSDVSALNKLDIIIDNISLEDIRLSFCTLRIVIEISNPTSRDISDLSAIFDIYIMDNYVGEGCISKLSLQKASYTKKELPITIYYTQVAAAVKDVILNRNFLLELKGTAEARVVFGLILISNNFVAAYNYP